MAKVFVTINQDDDVTAATDTGCEVLAEYPDAILVRCNDDQQAALVQRGLEIAPVEEPDIEITGHRFNMARAMEAEMAAPVPVDPQRVAYYLVKLVGPVKEEWLEDIRSRGGIVQGNMPGFALLIGMLPDRVPDLEQQSWIEAITPYRPSMKISPKLAQGPRSSPGAAELAFDDATDAGQESTVQVEISLFDGEDVNALEQAVKDAGGIVLSKKRIAVAAVVSPRTVNELARRQEVQAIVPHELPKLHNDRARRVMRIPDHQSFGGTVLTGRGQIVAICDSGLDTGNIETVHEDFRSRIIRIESLPVATGLAPFTNDPPGHDDGPADTGSAHGTHVAGSVLGSGATARRVGSTVVPQGVAPEAVVFFQAVEQTVHWKSAGQLMAEGIPVPIDWPPEHTSLYGLPDDLGTLFAPAYDAGARIHTNSWGADVAGVYNANAHEVDEFVWTHPDMLVLFSAGNAGRDADSNGAIDADSIGSPATAKNCLTVGASENDRPADSDPTPGINRRWNQLQRPDGSLRYPALGAAGHISDNLEGMAAFSSRGPTDDGRIKPDVVAPGTNILSTRSAAFEGMGAPLWGDLPVGHALRGLYCWSGGTSMSTPLVAGTATLLRQWLVEHGFFQDGVSPSAALLKALLIHGAQEMQGQFAGELPQGQNFVSGFGRVSLSGLLESLEGHEVLIFDAPELAVSSQQMRTFKVRALHSTRAVKATLVWTDAPSPANVGGLQNRLYLQVRQPEGDTLNGDLRPFPNAINNVQQRIINSPSNGVYEIRVRGVNVITQSPRAVTGGGTGQDFVLVMSNASQILP